MSAVAPLLLFVAAIAFLMAGATPSFGISAMALAPNGPLSSSVCTRIASRRGISSAR